MKNRDKRTPKTIPSTARMVNIRQLVTSRSLVCRIVEKIDSISVLPKGSIAAGISLQLDTGWVHAVSRRPDALKPLRRRVMTCQTTKVFDNFYPLKENHHLRQQVQRDVLEMRRC